MQVRALMDVDEQKKKEEKYDNNLNWPNILFRLLLFFSI